LKEIPNVNGVVTRFDLQDHRDANMFPYWADVPLTASQIAAVLVAVGGWLTVFMTAHGLRG
jgi:hypothetical protein